MHIIVFILKCRKIGITTKTTAAPASLVFPILFYKSLFRELFCIISLFVAEMIIAAYSFRFDLNILNSLKLLTQE